jgi:hypothetical protein
MQPKTESAQTLGKLFTHRNERGNGEGEVQKQERTNMVWGLKSNPTIRCSEFGML